MGVGDLIEEVESYMDISGKELDSLIYLASEEGDNSSAGRKLNEKLVKGMNRKIQEEGFVNAPAFDQIYSVVSLAPFTNSEEETHYIAKIVKENIKSKNVSPYIVDSLLEYSKGNKESTFEAFMDTPLTEKKQLAEKLLISTSFFYPILEKRWKYHQAPAPSFYERINKILFSNIDREDVSENYEKWEGFLPEQFSVGEGIISD